MRSAGLSPTRCFHGGDDKVLAENRAKVDAILDAHPLYPGLEY